MPVPLVAAALATLIQTSSAPDDVCYDLAILGRIRDARNFADLNDLVPPQTLRDVLMGGRVDIDIGVDEVLVGVPTSSTIRARAVLTHSLKPTARLVILLRRGPVEPGRENTVQAWNGGFIPRASSEIPWRLVLVRSWRAGFDPADPSLPPRCS
jgi:hypothetical protein